MQSELRRCSEGQGVAVHALLDGPQSLREPSERVAFWATALLALPAALAIGYVLHESIGASQVALLIVVAMVYVTLARGRLLGTSVRIHQRQYARVSTIVRRACASLEIPMPLVFVREDNNVPVVALGFGEPYALVLSSHWVELFDDDELAFMIGRELGHIAAGHTRFQSLLSANGNENPVVGLIFGPWLRRSELTCDRIGLLCCGSIDAAIRAMGIAAFHAFGRQVDYERFSEQHEEIQADSVLRWGEWLSGEPYATRRIASLRRFASTQAYTRATAWFKEHRREEPPALAAPGEAHVTTGDCAGWWRRFAAWSIDAIVVSAIITSFGGNVAPGTQPANGVVVAPGKVNVNVPGFGNIWVESDRRVATIKTRSPASRSTPLVSATPAQSKHRGVHWQWTNPLAPLPTAQKSISLDTLGDVVSEVIQALGFAFWFPVYLAALVILAGQTLGMMIVGLRVVTVDYRKPGVARTIARYAIAGILWWIVVPFSLFWHRILLHDRWTKTRLVRVERVVARITGAP